MFSVDQNSRTPAFEQLKEQITEGRDSGQLAAGYQLPPVRRLAEELHLAPNTVAKAYKELESAGVIETRGRHGSFITGTEETADKAATHATHEFIASMRALHISDTRIIELILHELEIT